MQEESVLKCSVCGKKFSRDEMIFLRNNWVCATCKPDFIQMLQEGTGIADITVSRKKKTLVMGKNAQLPDQCVKCNAPANGIRLKQNLIWHNPFIYLALLANILIYLIIALCVRKRAKIEVGLCERHLSKRKQSILITWILSLSSIALIIGGAATESVFALVGGLLLVLVALIYGVASVTVIRPCKIDKEYIWLNGVCQEYLDDLPEWVKPD